jgi:hypothetical protein
MLRAIPQVDAVELDAVGGDVGASFMILLQRREK